MDMNPLTIKAVWGFNGTERPGAVYLAAIMAAHAQRKLPAFAIYGHDVQDVDDTSIPGDVAEKILLWAKAALAVGVMRGKSYVNIGGPCMGIAGSVVDAQMFQEYFGLRTEWLDQVEIERRIARKIIIRRNLSKLRPGVMFIAARDLMSMPAALLPIQLRKRPPNGIGSSCRP
jgi:L-fucose isomerase